MPTKEGQDKKDRVRDTFDTTSPRYLTVTVDEGQHADDEEIRRDNFPWPQLVPGWAKLDPNTKNPRLDKSYTKGHHGACGRGKKKSDFEEFRFGFCLEHCEDNDGAEYRCLNQFAIQSTQCKDHPRLLTKDCPNRIWAEMKAGRVGNWGMLKKTDYEPVARASAIPNYDELPWHEIQAATDERVAAGEHPETAWNTTMAEFKGKKAIAGKIEKEEAREKMQASQKPVGDLKSRNTRTTRNLETQKFKRPVGRDPVQVPPRTRRRKQGARGKDRSDNALEPVDEYTTLE